ncbi:MAG TPA: hypothetical protein EYP17_03455 [Candidatus Latescibacteria bacterium]|nr:hypothetical protein [Candidatus Latescibacterota bacterium]
MRKLFQVFLALLLSSPTGAWWEKGHRIATEAALRMLPGDTSEFFGALGDVLMPLSAAPDRWNAYGPTARAGWRRDHFMDLEFLDLPLGKFLKEYPDRFAVLEHWCRTEEKVPGLLPYHILELYEVLKGVLGELRERPVDLSLRVQAVFFAGSLAHFTEDLSQPLHLTVHYDGRVNKKGELISNKGIHDRFEGPIVEQFIEAWDLLPYMYTPEAYEDVQEALVRAMEESYRLVDRVYALDNRRVLEKATPEAVRFVTKRLAAGAQLTADLWYTAWVQGGREGR